MKYSIKLEIKSKNDAEEYRLIDITGLWNGLSAIKSL